MARASQRSGRFTPRGGGRAAGHRGPSLQGEAGNLLALEGVFVALMLVTSVAIVSTFELAPPERSPGREAMEDIVKDLLAGIEALPTPDRYGSYLERAVGQAVLGNATPLDTVVKRVLPPGAQCRLWIDNGHAQRLLAGPADRLARESVTAARLYHPTWAYALVVPSLELVSPIQPLDLQGFAVSQGALVKEEGIPVQVSVATSHGLYDKAAVTAVRHRAPTASLYLLDEAGQPNVAYRGSQRVYEDSGDGLLEPSGSFEVPRGFDTLRVRGQFLGDAVSLLIVLQAPDGSLTPLSASGSGEVRLEETVSAAEGLWSITTSGDLIGGATAAMANLAVVAERASPPSDWSVVVKEEAGFPLPAGTRLTLRPPYVFEGIDRTPATQPGWRNIAVAKDGREGAIVTAELDSPLAGASRTFSLHAEPPPLTPDAAYLLQAELGNGSAARAHFVLNTGKGTTMSHNPVQHGVYASAPKPVAPGSTSLWGVAFNYASTSNGGAPEVVRQLDLRAADGRAFAQAVEGLAPPGTWTLLAPDHVRWTGNAVVFPNEALSFVARLTAVSEGTPYEPARALPVDFKTGLRFELGEQARPYVFAGSVPPPVSGRGYEVPAFGVEGGILKGNASLGVDWTARAKRVQGNATYSVSPHPTLDALQEALRLGLARSHLNLSKRSAFLGEPVTITPDFQGLLDALNLRLEESGGTLLLVDWGAEVLVLDPAQPFAPPQEWKPSLRAAFTSAATSVEFTPAPGSFYGPHAVLAKATFTVRDAVNNVDIVQTARLLAIIDVLPDSGQSETALYWVSLECWLPDWQ